MGQVSTAEEISWQDFGFPHPGFMPVWRPAEGLMKALAERELPFAETWDFDSIANEDQLQFFGEVANGQHWCREFDRRLKNVCTKYLNHLKLKDFPDVDFSTVMWTWEDLLLNSTGGEKSMIADPSKGDLSPEWNLLWLLQRYNAINLLLYAPVPFKYTMTTGSVHTGEPSTPKEAYNATLAPGEKESMLRYVRKALSNLACILLLFGCALMPLPTAAGESPVAGDAVATYEAGQYSKALQMFQEESDVRNEAVRLFNIANCEYRLGNPGKAALGYARALLVAPGFPEAEANLAFIQRKEGALLPAHSTIDKIFTFFSCSKLWVITIICTAILALCISLQIAWHHKRHLGWLHALTIVFAVFSLLCATNWVYYLGQQKPDITALPPQDVAYILTPTTARNAADEAGSSIIQLTPSTPVRILAHRASWCYIETATGVRGWIPTHTAEALEPGGSPQMPVLIRF